MHGVALPRLLRPWPILPLPVVIRLERHVATVTGVPVGHGGTGETPIRPVALAGVVTCGRQKRIDERRDRRMATQSARFVEGRGDGSRDQEPDQVPAILAALTRWLLIPPLLH